MLPSSNLQEPYQPIASCKCSTLARTQACTTSITLLACEGSCVPVQNQHVQRVPNGLNRNRLSLIMAVLAKHAGLRLSSTDLHTNVVGGLTMSEPATDLAVAIAIASSYYEQPTPADCAVVGELGEPASLRCIGCTNDCGLPMVEW